MRIGRHLAMVGVALVMVLGGDAVRRDRLRGDIRDMRERMRRELSEARGGESAEYHRQLRQIVRSQRREHPRVQRVARRKTITIERWHRAVDPHQADVGSFAHQQFFEKFVDDQTEDTGDRHAPGCFVAGTTEP